MGNGWWGLCCHECSWSIVPCVSVIDKCEMGGGGRMFVVSGVECVWWMQCMCSNGVMNV